VTFCISRGSAAILLRRGEFSIFWCEYSSKFCIPKLLNSAHFSPSIQTIKRRMFLRHKASSLMSFSRHRTLGYFSHVGGDFASKISGNLFDEYLSRGICLAAAAAECGASISLVCLRIPFDRVPRRRVNIVGNRGALSPVNIIPRIVHLHRRCAGCNLGSQR